MAEYKPQGQKTVLVVGHRNPDTDSICSAIAYAYLKNKINPALHYEPRRAGALSSETKFVLSYFGSVRRRQPSGGGFEHPPGGRRERQHVHERCMEPDA